MSAVIGRNLVPCDHSHPLRVKVHSASTVPLQPLRELIQQRPGPEGAFSVRRGVHLVVQSTAGDGVSEIEVSPVGSDDRDLSEPVRKWNGPPGEVRCAK